VPVTQITRLKAATVIGTISTTAGVFLGRGQSERVTIDADRTSLREGFRTDFDLSRMTPGSYILTLEARSSDTGSRVVKRQIPFTIE
jgi:hypothetical protein